MTIPLCNQADLMTLGPRPVRERRCFDANGRERTQLRSGACQCPQCGLWWPLIEDPCGWVEEYKRPDDTTPIRWFAVEWWGAAMCEICGLLMVEQPDGTGEVYQL